MNNYDVTINELKKINKQNWNKLNFWKIVNNNFEELSNKIIISHLWKRFDFNFTEKKTYIKELSIFIKNKIFNNENLNISDYEELYIKIFSPFFRKKELWFRNKLKMNITWLDENWKKIDFYCNYTEIVKKLEIIFSKYNNKNLDLFERLYYLIIENLNKIHPFSNNNFWFSSILLDLLLIKNNFLPVNIKKTFKVNNIFYPNKEIFTIIILKRYKNYKY